MLVLVYNINYLFYVKKELKILINSCILFSKSLYLIVDKICKKTADLHNF